MNNQQFRRLVLESTPARQQSSSSPPNGDGRAPAASATLGSRKSSFIPMTPRNVGGRGGVDFARQLFERQKAESETHGGGAAKKFRSSAAPKGSKLAAGYQDRARLERTDEEKDELAKRIKALEEQMKLGQIDRETFERLRDELVGGDLSKTHLVKGLDRKLLERVRRGEDVFAEKPKEEQKVPEPAPEVDVDEEFENLEHKEVAPIVKEKAEKKGQLAPAPVAGQKRSRDAILAELKAARAAAAEAKKAAMPELGSKFKKIGPKPEEVFPRIERDAQGREVLITKDENGNIKRKVRKTKTDDGAKAPLPMPDPSAKPLGMEVPELPPAPPSEDSDGDIFEGVGNDYDPLAGLEESSDSSDEEDEGKERDTKKARPDASPASGLGKGEEPEEGKAAEKKEEAAPPNPVPKRNYFDKLPTSTTETLDAVADAPRNPLADPSIINALCKAQKIDISKFDPSARLSDDEEGEGQGGKDAEAALRARKEEEERLRRRAAMLAGQDRDLEDMDLGFGGSRLEDADELDEDGERIKLAEWKGFGADDDDDGRAGNKGRGGGKRKRGPKKKKADKNNVADIMKIVESRKK